MKRASSIHFLVAVILAVPAFAVGAQQNVYRCPGPDGAVKITDQPCSDGHAAYTLPPPKPRPLIGNVVQSQGTPPTQQYPSPYDQPPSQYGQYQAPTAASVPEHRRPIPRNYTTEIENAQRACANEQRSIAYKRMGAPSCEKASQLIQLQRLETEAQVSRETGQRMPDRNIVVQPPAHNPGIPQHFMDQRGRPCTLLNGILTCN